MGVRSILYRSFRDNVQLGTLLAFVAGNINSIAFVQFGTYVSHVSGHATRAAITYAEGDFTSAFLFFMEFFAFIFGAGLTSFLMRGYTAASTKVKVTGPIFIELGLIFFYLVSVEASRKELVTPAYLSHLTFLLAVAMGMQNAMLRQASGATVRTTHITGVSTDFGFELGAALRLGCEALFARQVELWKRPSHAGKIFLRRLSLSRFLFHAFILLAFSSGAVVGTIAYLLYKDYSLITPMIVLFVLGCREFKRPPVSLEQSYESS